MSVEISTPFSLNINGGIASTTDSNVQVTQHLQSLVSTEPGERVMMPLYGVPTASSLFAPNAAINQSMLLADIQSAVSTWEPTVDIDSIAVNPLPGDVNGSISLAIDWSQISINPQIQTATVLIGGKVVDY